MENSGKRELNWEEIETKISIICRKFDNIPASLMDDLAQELRIHAYYKSDDYYDLFRRAISFWRSLNASKNSDLPFFDLEMIGGSSNDRYDYNMRYIANEIKKELKRTPSSSYWDSKMIERAGEILDIVLHDIDDRLPPVEPTNFNIVSKKYINGRISLSWLSESLGISYRSAENTMNFLADTVLGLVDLGKITVDDESLLEYFKHKRGLE